VAAQDTLQSTARRNWTRTSTTKNPRHIFERILRKGGNGDWGKGSRGKKKSSGGEREDASEIHEFLERGKRRPSKRKNGKERRRGGANEG